MSESVALTEEQEELRLRGLRILARMIVRAYISNLAEPVERSGEPPPTSKDDSLIKEEQDVA